MENTVLEVGLGKSGVNLVYLRDFDEFWDDTVFVQGSFSLQLMIFLPLSLRTQIWVVLKLSLRVEIKI
jgi:hypothetical protein